MNDLSLDEIVRTSDQQAVRARFDARNLSRVRFLGWLALAGCMPGLVVSLAMRSWWRAAIVICSAILSLVNIRTTPAHAAGRLATAVRLHTSAYVIGWCVLQMACAVLISSKSEALIACATMFPLFMLGLRMLPAELLSLHGMLALLVIASVSIAPPVTKAPEGFIAPVISTAIIMNGFAFAIEALSSRRWRREIVAAWSERRAIAQEQVRMRDELHFAREVQLSMLPESPPHLEWLDLAGLSLPATEVGGDYYDYLEVDEGLAIVTGDVAGHGLASGIVLAALRGGITLLRDRLGDPAAVLRRLHELVLQTSRRRMLVTCALILFDRRRGRATIASAGHPPILLRRAAGGSVTRVELFAPPLGVKLPLNVESHEIAFEPGDVFVLHSDGVYESRNAAGESYGLERLECVVRDTSGAAWEICDAIARDLERFRGEQPQDDDVTIVVAKIA